MNTKSKDIPVNVLSSFLENPENVSLFNKIGASDEQKISLCYAYNYFKKYLGNMNILKDYKMLWHMFSIPLDLALSERLRILKDGLILSSTACLFCAKKKLEKMKELNLFNIN